MFWKLYGAFVAFSAFCGDSNLPMYSLKDAVRNFNERQLLQCYFSSLKPKKEGKKENFLHQICIYTAKMRDSFDSITFNTQNTLPLP